MRIYVAGTVLRSRLEAHVHFILKQLYCELEWQAGAQGHTIMLPYPEAWLDQLEVQEFKEEILRRIDNADFVISIHYPPNEMVAFEAQHAAERNKPSVIVVHSQYLPSLPPILLNFRHYDLNETTVEELLSSLNSARNKTDENPPMRSI
jgi:hypothetical protein